MSDRPTRLPGDLKHLDRLLSRWSREEPAGVTAGRLRRLVGVTVIAAMLDGLRDDDGRERTTFKGGTALELRFGLRARASKDLGAERTNQRVRDLDDLILIEALAVTDADLHAIRGACVEIFAGRGKHPLPPTIRVWGDWEVLWERLVEDEGMAVTLADAVEAVNTFVAAIDAAR